ncbi:LacI family DNA-binding transcriptional regulator [Tianweitania sediminis]|uniref:LacI family DNA-binding transcriptional regulator n=1 Tax=Tianweitania sediminis TaxID=1502156 RepID=A0A8J7UJE8_9HYPH|nr:LacI family DNA-binding transcriptional regulator [Tianweitania sediminis]MBP0439968.1 LacI family DNA-binding transcriptional regulator [Tianweitania sediminis]
MTDGSMRRRKGWSTMADVAREAGVSLMTVSRVYKRPDSVSQRTREKVLETGNRLGFSPNSIAGNLASGRTSMIGIVVPSLRNSNNATSIQGMADYLRQASYHFMIANTGYSMEDETAVVKAFMQRRPDGMVLTGTRHGRETIDLLKAAHVPVVETWETRGPFIDMATGFKNYEAARRITRHLVDRGYRRIGYIDYPAIGLDRYIERLRGLKEELKAAGFEPVSIVSPLDPGDLYQDASSFRGGSLGLRKLQEASGDINAVLCASDILAVGVLFECQRQGLRVPDQLAVAGFGDFEIAAEVPPGLTTIRTHGYQIGWNAAEMLVTRINQPRAEIPLRDVGYELVVRGSS